jgi:hypothetical protein
MVRLPNFTITEIRCSRSPKNIRIHDLPVEILTKIFIFSAPNDLLNHRQPDTTIPPMLLCQVCSNWRGLVFNTPTLWVYLYYIAKFPGWESYYTCYELAVSGHVGLKGCIRPVDTQFLTWWIGNSQATPLVFRFEFGFNKVKSNGLLEIQMRMQRKIWERMKVNPAVLLFRIISNARGLYLNDFTSVVLQKDLSHRNLQFPNLRSLANLSNLSSSGSDIGPILHLGTLRHLIYHKPQVLDNDILWANLTHISIKTLSISSNEWCNLIRCLEALQVGEFAATVNALETRTTMEYSSKKLPHLRELRLSLYLNSDIDFNPLPNLIFPSLTMLHYDGPNITPNFLRILFLASPHLITLRLGRRHSPLDEADIFKFAMSEWRVWGDALRLEELIIDDPTLSPSYRTRFLLDIQLHPPPNLRRVHFTIKLFLFKRWRLKFMEWRLRCKPGINVVLREGTNRCYWGLSPSEHRAWMEIWYVVILCAAKLSTKTTFADSCDRTQAPS